MNQPKMKRCISSFYTADNKFVREGTELPENHELVRNRDALWVFADPSEEFKR